METLFPTDISECRRLIAESGDRISSGTADIVIHEDWVSDLTSDEQALLAGHSSKARKVLASSRATKPSILKSLSENVDEFVRRRVAGNPVTPVDLLVKLASDNSVVVREGVAGNPAATAECLERLSYDPAASVRWWVATNDQVTTAILTRLSGDENLHVRYSVAQNAATPLAVLTNLRSDPESVVRNKVIYNPKFRTGRCFIATACYGDADAESVRILRNFRDNVLITSGPGNFLVNCYCRFSPPLANLLLRHPVAAQFIRRLFLDPMVRKVCRAGYGRFKVSDQAEP